MDFFQGSSPPTFISFCLENQNEDDQQIPANTEESIPAQPNQVSTQIVLSESAPISALSPPSFHPTRNLFSQVQAAVDSLFSTDSNVDVTAYATEMVQRMEAARTASEDIISQTATVSPKTTGNADDLTPSPPTDPRRTSTPKSGTQHPSGSSNLSQLEMNLKIAESTETGFPELQPTTSTSKENAEAPLSQAEEDSSSIFSEPPPLPGKPAQSTSCGSDIDTPGEISGLDNLPPLYGIIPGYSELDSEKGTETELEECLNNLPGTSRMTSEEPLRELSGRSRAILKQYFEAENAYTFPVGHRTVAFTEPQIYHLLRVLTDEAINMTCSTMERMVIGAVKGTPATAPSRTKHFLTRTRAQTPKPLQSGNSSSEEATTDPGQDSESHGDFSALYEVGDISMPEDSDSSGEMALIADTFRKSTYDSAGIGQKPHSHSSSAVEEVESTGHSSMDATLSELRDQPKSQKSSLKKPCKKVVRPKRASRRGVPMREEFFSKIGWTRSFISGPADPLHNPHMVWCHMCKKNFSIKTKGVVEILRHHRTERHLRRDQRWRYEHLKSVDPVTGKVHHRVRGRNGKILSKAELAQELPHFIHTELIDVGERFPFYEDYLRGNTAALVTPQSRDRTQIHLIGDFIQRQGDIAVLRNLWSRVGSFTEYQAAFRDFDWSEDRIMVSIFCSSRFVISIRRYIHTYICKYPGFVRIYMRWTYK